MCVNETCICTWVYVHACVHVFVYGCLGVWACVHASVYMRVCVFTFNDAFTDTCIHIHMT